MIIMVICFIDNYRTQDTIFFVIDMMFIIFARIRIWTLINYYLL